MRFSLDRGIYPYLLERFLELSAAATAVLITRTPSTNGDCPASNALVLSRPDLQVRQRRTKHANDSAAVRTFKLGLCPTPLARSSLQCGTTGIRKRDCAAATISGGRRDLDVPHALKWPKILAHRRAIEIQVPGEAVHGNAAMLAQQRKDRVLGDPQTSRRKLTIVEVGYASGRPSQRHAVALFEWHHSCHCVHRPPIWSPEAQWYR